MTDICVSKLTIIGSDNGLSPDRRQAIIWTNAGILLIRTLGTRFSGILSEIHRFSFWKMHLKTSSAKWRPFCLGLNVLMSPFGCQPVDPPASLVIINRIIYVYGFLVVMMLLLYSILHCLYSVGIKITTTTTSETESTTHKGSVMGIFYVFVFLSLCQLLKQSNCCWFEAPCDGLIICKTP